MQKSKALVVSAGMFLSVLAHANFKVADLFTMKEFSYEGEVIGTTSDTNKKLKGFPLCIVDVKFTAKWDFDSIKKGTKYFVALACKPNDAGMCPDDARVCFKDSEADSSFDWQTAKGESAEATKKPGGDLSCKYDGIVGKEPRVILRELKDEQSQTVLDGVCASRVECAPQLKSPIAVCKPRKAGKDSGDEFVCPQATDCVAEQLPLTKPKADVSDTKPHGGKAKSTHASNGEEKR